MRAYTAKGYLKRMIQQDKVANKILIDFTDI